MIIENYNSIAVLKKAQDFFNKHPNKIEQSYVELGVNNINIFLAAENGVIVYESMPTNKLLIEEDDIYDTINFPSRILHFFSPNKYDILYDHKKQCN
jgi:hypothetical protein